MKDYDRQVHPTGETLPEVQRVFRVKVVSSFLRAGVPLNKLQYFREVLQNHAYRLADNRGMYDLIPFVLADETKQIKAEIDSKNLSVIFDGTTRLGEALAIIVRFMTGWKVEQRLVRLQLLVKSMSGEEIAREIVNTLSVEYGVSVDRILATMHDRASANEAAVRTLRVLYPNILDVGCFP